MIIMAKLYNVSLEDLNETKYKVLIFALGVLIFAISIWVYCTQVYLKPQNVFWGMVDANLTTPGFYKKDVQANTDTTLTQETQVSLANVNVAQTRTTVSQKQGKAENKVVTEMIGTTNTDYVRYADIKTSGPENKAFSSIVGVWGKTEYGKDDTVSGKTFISSLLNTFPIGSISASQRKSLIELMKQKKAFTVNYENVKHEVVSGRNVMTYQVTFHPEGYAFVLQQFAKDIGIGTIPGFSPEAYKASPPSTIAVSVEPFSRQLVGITYPDQGREETYGSYGLVEDVALPSKSISSTQLQQRIQSLQQ